MSAESCLTKLGITYEIYTRTWATPFNWNFEEGTKDWIKLNTQATPEDVSNFLKDWKIKAGKNRTKNMLKQNLLKLKIHYGSYTKTWARPYRWRFYPYTEDWKNLIKFVNKNITAEEMYIAILEICSTWRKMKIQYKKKM